MGSKFDDIDCRDTQTPFIGHLSKEEQDQLKVSRTQEKLNNICNPSAEFRDSGYDTSTARVTSHYDCDTSNRDPSMQHDSQFLGLVDSRKTINAIKRYT